MAASKQNPNYTVALIDQAGTRYNLTGVLLDISLSETEGQIAQTATIKVVNTNVGSGYLTGIVKVRNRVFIYATDGEKNEEVFRGIVWERRYSSKTEKELEIICYDNLIYFQESEENMYFTAGKATKAICEEICKKWKVPLDYKYESITHGKLPLRGTLSDIFLSDVLDPVRKQTGKKFVMRSSQDAVQILPVGSNPTVYELKRITGNVIDTKSNITMDGMVTKVVILGKEDKEGRSKVEATIDGDTATYGTLQKIESKDENTTLETAKKEANEIIKEKGHPKTTYDVTAADIPWIRKGDKVKVFAGDMTEQYIVLSISREISTKRKIMSLTVELAT